MTRVPRTKEAGIKETGTKRRRSMKAKKGNPFERLVAYNLMQAGYSVERLDDNTKGIDLIVGNHDIVECKFHQKLSWNQLIKIYDKTNKTALKTFPDRYIHPVVVFKTNQQPILVFSKGPNGKPRITTFEDEFGLKQNLIPIPKGYKVWKQNQNHS